MALGDVKISLNRGITQEDDKRKQEKKRLCRKKASCDHTKKGWELFACKNC